MSQRSNEVEMGGNSIKRMIGILFGEKFEYDLFDDTLFEFSIGTSRCALTHPSTAFFTQMPLLVALQTVVSALLAYPLYKLNVQDKRRAILSTIFTFLVALPIACYEPIYVIHLLDIRHLGLRMVLMTLPLNGGLRILESYGQFVDEIPAKNFTNYFAYFCCPFILKFDDIKQEPKRISLKYIQQQLTIVGTYYVYIAPLISFLWYHQWEVFQMQSVVNSFDHTFYELISWKHLINNYLMALLLSLTLKQSTVGVSLLYSLAFGNETQDVVLHPMFQSQSVSGFWGKQWNIAVHQGLKNGVYKPVRSFTNSKVMGVLAAFVASGAIHEYVNLVLTPTVQFKWKYMMFFGWNACLMFVEYAIGSIDMVQNLLIANMPKPLITAVVLCTALPVAHLFTGDWIVHGYFDSLMYPEMSILCR